MDMRALLIAAAVAFAAPAWAQDKFITVASTTSTEQSGLFKHMLPIFEKKAGVQVRVVALGTGQSLDMGTHFAEVSLWKVAGIDIAKDKGPWYRDTGSGMGPTLNTAAGMNAYALTDRGTWLSFKNRGDLVISVEGDKRLFNQYGIMLVNPAKHAHVKKDLGQAFIDWVISAEGQKAIADYKIGGEQLFFPNAAK
jgi:ABC-type tungstate transport system permease subunit